MSDLQESGTRFRTVEMNELGWTNQVKVSEKSNPIDFCTLEKIEKPLLYMSGVNTISKNIHGEEKHQPSQCRG